MAGRQAGWARLGLLGLALAGRSWGQDPGVTRLEELLNAPISIATRRPQPEDSAPSVVSVVNRIDIERYGWRDLHDILMALPGFEFGADGTGLVGLSARGIWAHEGKALVMINGITVSPLHNGNVNYYGFIPSEMVERVEVIRGPGSAVYGQFAGVTVINVLTRSAQDTFGGRLALRGSTLGAGNHGGGAFLSASSTIQDKASLSVTAGYLATPFSNQPYVAQFAPGQPSFDQSKGNSRRENTYVTGELQALGTEIHFLRTAFQIAQVDGGGNGPQDPTVPGLPPGLLGSGSRVVQGFRIFRSTRLGERLALEAGVRRLENQMGVVYPRSVVGGGIFTSGNTRSQTTLDLNLRWTPAFGATVLAGGGVIQDWERSVNNDNQGALRDPGDPRRTLPQITMSTRFGYVQMDQPFQVGDFQLGGTLGARYEESRLNHAFAPRLGLTLGRGPFAMKLLYGEAFREPTLFQGYSTLFAYNPDLLVEQIKCLEAEASWYFNPQMVLRGNLYRMVVERSIEGSFNSEGRYYVRNTGRLHARGIEVSFAVRHYLWGGFANLSLNEPGREPAPFFLGGDRKRFLGTSTVRMNLGAYVRAGAFQIAPSLFYGSPRDSQSAASAQSGFQPGTLLPALIESESLPARLLLNLAVTWKACLGEGTEARLALHNLGQDRAPFVMHYYGGHPPLPSNDRSVTLDLVWRF